MTKIKDIENLISNIPNGQAFVISDFTDNFEYRTIQKSLERLADSGKIRRIMRGVYDKPYYSEILQAYSAPSIYEVAKAIARNYNWNIVPSGVHALNMLGLSTQVPYTCEFVSDGPYRNYNVYGNKIIFYHKNNKEINGLSFKSALVIQAIRALGKENITKKEKRILSSMLSDDEKKVLLSEAKFTTTWIYSIIKQICTEE